jgi:CubicO group peptidase (beta-lactamase class C family)
MGAVNASASGRYFLAPAALVALLTACATQPVLRFDAAIASSRADIERIAKADSIPAVAVAVTSGDRIVWMESLGVADPETHAPLTVDSQFRIGSVSKLLTATALLRLAEQGKLRLDDPVSRYLPDFPHGESTLRQLAGHLGGIRHYAGGEFMNRTKYPSVRASLSKFAADPMIAKPGEKYYYSSYGYNLLGAAIEAAAGKPFVDVVQTLVLTPLRMRDTVPDTAAKHAVTPYEADKGVMAPAPAADISDRVPAGGYVSTARDLARFAIGLTSPAFLSAESRQLIRTVQNTSDGKPTRVGIGWRVGVDDAGRTFLHHGGMATGGRAFILVYPEERVSVSIVTNVTFANFGDKEAREIALRFFGE